MALYKLPVAPNAKGWQRELEHEYEHGSNSCASKKSASRSYA